VSIVPPVECPTPGCGNVLRRNAGTLRDGEPSVWSDEAGEFVRCPKCHGRIAWPVEEDRRPGDEPAV
jgi:hypothetical protein